MLFKDYHLDLIRRGEKTVTRREWDKPQVTVGGVYMAATEMFTSHEDADCYIQVTDLYRQMLGKMTDPEAEGDYETMDEFIEGYERVYGEGSWNPLKEVWVVEFEYVGREQPTLSERMGGCPACGFSADLDERIPQMEALLLGPELAEAEGYEQAGVTEDDLVCSYHRAEFRRVNREAVDALVEGRDD